MSESAFSNERRAATAYYWSGGERLTADEFRKLDVIQQASYLATNPMPDGEAYERLKREDAGFDPDAIVPGTALWDDGITDDNGDWK